MTTIRLGSRVVGRLDDQMNLVEGTSELVRLFGEWRTNGIPQLGPGPRTGDPNQLTDSVYWVKPSAQTAYIILQELRMNGYEV